MGCASFLDSVWSAADGLLVKLDGSVLWMSLAPPDEEQLYQIVSLSART